MMRIDDWEALLLALADARKAGLDDAVRAHFASRANAARTVLESPNSSEIEVRVAQGEVKAYKRAIIVFEDLTRLARAKGRPQRSSNAETN